MLSCWKYLCAALGFYVPKMANCWYGSFRSRGSGFEEAMVNPEMDDAAVVGA